jgi:hypothetical protein
VFYGPIHRKSLFIIVYNRWMNFSKLFPSFLRGAIAFVAVGLFAVAAPTNSVAQQTGAMEQSAELVSPAAADTPDGASGQTSGGASQPQSFFERYQARVSATQAEQPHWVTPVVTVTPRLEQELRTDFVHQYNSAARSVWNYGNGKGLEFIPASRVEILINVPPFFNRSNGESDGFGDMTFNSKFRFFARNEEHGNAILTGFFAASIPTGKNGNGSCCAVVTPTLAGGKGFGPVALTSTLGGSLPISNTKGLGHGIVWNNTLQYHVAKTGAARFFWPEVESNTTFFKGGADDGDIMSFVTPGVVIGRIPLTRDATGKPGRLGLTFGAGEQIAVSHFHTYNHATVLSLRIPF